MMVGSMKISFLAFVLGIILIQKVDGHGIMVKPYNWFDFKQTIYLPNGTTVFDYVGMRSGYQCLAGCRIPRDVVCTEEHSCEEYPGNPGCACFWYQNNTVIEKPTLFDPTLRTYVHVTPPEKYLFHPWRAPGRAKIESPCGVAGGNYNGCVGGKCNIKKGGFGYGPKAEKVPFPYDFAVTNWTRGDVVEVAWAITANHGGGYSYRLCKFPEEGASALTEECFQQTPLDFVGETQWVQYGEDESTRIEIPAVRVSKGTFPIGSQWTRNPIPACIGALGGFYYPTRECPKGTQFKPPKPELYGFGVNSDRDIANFRFSIVDKIRIPSDLPAGKYVLSFRWDTEQTPQVWNTCADIKLS